MIIIFIGPPGSGKGTQSLLVSKKLDIPFLSTGEVLRLKAESGTDEGNSLKEMMKSGQLIPSELINDFILEYLNKNSAGCILDGYPRNLEQAKFLRKNINQDVKVFYFDISHEVLVKRITGRFSCKNCGKIYNRFFSRLKNDVECDVCQSTEFVTRDDDNETSITKRLNIYKRETVPVVDYYRRQGVLTVVDATKFVDRITEELLVTLKSH